MKNAMNNPKISKRTQKTTARTGCKEMKTSRKHGLTALFTMALLGLMAAPSFASVEVGVTTTAHNDSPNSFNWTITDFNNPTPSVSTTTPSGDIFSTTPSISGSLDDAGNFNGSESLVLNLYGTKNWNSFTPDAATFDTQIEGIRGDQDLRMFNSQISTGNALLNGTNAALILEIDTDNAGIVTLLDLRLGNTGGDDKANFIVWDSDASTFLTNQTVRSSNLSYGNYTLTTGDIVVLGVDESNTGDFRLVNFELDVTPIPEPSTLALVGTFTCMALMVGISRRRRTSW